MTRRGHLLIALALAMAALLPAVTHAQAFCALRDPTSQIYQLYPQADSYRSIVRQVNATTRSNVNERLQFTIHSRELGEHTLYVAMAKNVPIGIVHVRSEPGDWGLIEIAWSIDLDLKLRGFAFQRCRGRACQSVDTEPFRAALAGRDLPAVRALLSADGNALQQQYPWAGPDNERLAVAVVRSALKTMAVTDAVWGKELMALQ